MGAHDNQTGIAFEGQMSDIGAHVITDHNRPPTGMGQLALRYMASASERKRNLGAAAGSNPVWPHRIRSRTAAAA
jgi:hypothetical protein